MLAAAILTAIAVASLLTVTRADAQVGGNQPPVATDDTVTISEDTATTIDVLANDSDEDGDTLAVASVGVPAHGTANVTPAGTIAYTPAAGFTGTDTFTYVVSDGQGHTDAATVTVTVQLENDEDGNGNARELKERCKDGGWTGLGFPNQGLCVAFYARMIGENDRNDEHHGWERIIAMWRGGDDHEDDDWKDRGQDHRDKDHHRGHDKSSGRNQDHDDD
jgi:hypothetical protein